MIRSFAHPLRFLALTLSPFATTSSRLLGPYSRVGVSVPVVVPMSTVLCRIIVNGDNGESKVKVSYSSVRIACPRDLAFVNYNILTLDCVSPSDSQHPDPPWPA